MIAVGLRAVFLPLALAALLGGCASLGPPRPPPPTTAEIVQLAKDGVPAAEIIKRMDDARAVYRLSASELARLRDQGVPDAVIDHMQRTYIEAERRREWLLARQRAMWYGWPGPRGSFSFGHGWGPYWGPGFYRW